MAYIHRRWAGTHVYCHAEHLGQLMSAATEMVEDIAAQKSKHSIAQIFGLHLVGNNHDPWRRTEQAALPYYAGNKRVPLDQRPLRVVSHESRDHLGWRSEHFRHGS